jgi:hypothetical protein
MSIGNSQGSLTICLRHELMNIHFNLIESRELSLAHSWSSFHTSLENSTTGLQNYGSMHFGLASPLLVFPEHAMMAASF